MSTNFPRPLPLPKFTFLCGGPQAARHALATAIANRDSEMLLQDFEEPLRNATHALFFGGFNIDRDLTKPEERFALLPNTHITVGYWLDELREQMRNLIGRGVLGRIALHNWIEDGQELFFQRGLWRDTQSPNDIDSFITKFGHDSCLCVHVGVLGPIHQGCRNIWLPIPDLDKQLLDLERELTPPPHREFRETANATGT